MPTSRRWRSFSIRTLLLVISASSVFCAWFFYYRRVQCEEMRRLYDVVAASNGHLNLRYTLMGWEGRPSEWFYLVATPEPGDIALRPNGESDLSDEVYEAARQCSRVEFYPARGARDISRAISEKTRELHITGTAPDDCLAVAAKYPNLRAVSADFFDLSAASLSAVLGHPGIESLTCEARASVLSQVQAPAEARNLQRLQISFAFERRDDSFAEHHGPPTPAEPVFNDEAVAGKTPPGNYGWLKGCPRLRELTIRRLADNDFFEAIGEHLGGVEQLTLEFAPSDQDWRDLTGWPKLRILCIDGGQLNDRHLAQIAVACPQLDTLEIDEYSGSPGSVTPAGIRELRGLSALRRLRLGKVRLTAEHVAVLSELHQLEQLSLEDSTLNDSSLAPLRQLPRLRQISLERTSATDAMFPSQRGDWRPSRPYRN